MSDWSIKLCCRISCRVCTFSRITLRIFGLFSSFHHHLKDLFRALIRLCSVFKSSKIMIEIQRQTNLAPKSLTPFRHVFRFGLVVKVFGVKTQSVVLSDQIHGSRLVVWVGKRSADTWLGTKLSVCEYFLTGPVRSSTIRLKSAKLETSKNINLHLEICSLPSIGKPYKLILVMNFRPWMYRVAWTF